MNPRIKKIYNTFLSELKDLVTKSEYDRIKECMERCITGKTGDKVSPEAKSRNKKILSDLKKGGLDKYLEQKKKK